MEKAIEVLKNEVVKCNYMEKFFENEFHKYTQITADQSELMRLRREETDLIETKESCLSAIDYLKTLR
jgi:hypothetical protein